MFKEEKLVAPEISLGGNFSYDKKGQYYSTTKVYGYVKNKDIKEGYLFWLGLLNSQLFWYFIQQTGYILRGGYFTFKTSYIMPFPIPKDFDEEKVLEIEHLVSQIFLYNKKGNTIVISEIEKKINDIIYDLYNLSNEEILIIKK
uniref:TaqI-like C-terminal specificity domain-containing protein n=1 Tax=Myroides marinus TaxID=703342 RepID=UPI002575096C|nr:TaqI-like C-terminal specificity domain-containing protein [Myroides marinus]